MTGDVTSQPEGAVAGAGAAVDAPYEAVCLNPRCGRAFRSAFPGKKTCSVRCQDALKKARRKQREKMGGVVEARVLREVAPMAGLPAVVGPKAPALRFTRDQKVAAFEDVQARILGSITDEVIDEATLQQRVTAAAIIEDKLAVIEARPPAPLKAGDRARALEVLAQLAARRERQRGAVDVVATEVKP